jgi:D-alanyl-D-alanine dipeptidase
MNLVPLKPLLPSETIYDIRYATTNNITGQVLYDAIEPQLDKPAAHALARAAKVLLQHGVRLVVWDVYRPIEVQRQLLAINDDPHYVLDAEASNHPKGLAFDGTLADAQGTYRDLGTDFDEFSPAAHANTNGLNDRQLANRQLLTLAMQSVGFKQWPYEWWHFDFTPKGYSDQP